MAGVDVKLAFVFPGQGSQRAGMLEAYTANEAAKAAIDEACTALGEDLLAISADAELISQTHNTQPLMLTADVAAWRAWQAAGGAMPAMVAGHSLGEYAALVAAGSLEFSQALVCVRERALAMQEAVPKGQGAMSAVLGLDREQVAQACAAADAAWPVNFNAPGQVVIGGAVEDVQKAEQACKDAGAKRVVRLPVGVSSHCALMQPAQERLAAALDALSIAEPQLPVVQNATSAVAADAATIKANLVAQIVSPVDWEKCVQVLAGQAGRMVECGPGRVLTGLDRRIAREAEHGALDSAAALQELLA